jgi:hypothetical protein
MLQEPMMGEENHAPHRRERGKDKERNKGGTTTCAQYPEDLTPGLIS